MIFVGDDWSEDHHDICVLDEPGHRLARRQLPEGVAGVSALHELLAGLAENPAEVAVAIETDRGLSVAALVAAGYRSTPPTPRPWRATGSATGAARAPSLMPPTPRCWPNWPAPTATTTVPLPVTAPGHKGSRSSHSAHQRLVWARRRQVNALRATLREFYPAALVAFGEDLGHPDALAVLAKAPSPELAVRLSVAQAAGTLRGQRHRGVEARAKGIRRCAPSS